MFLATNCEFFCSGVTYSFVPILESNQVPSVVGPYFLAKSIYFPSPLSFPHPRHPCDYDFPTVQAVISVHRTFLFFTISIFSHWNPLD